MKSPQSNLRMFMLFAGICFLFFGCSERPKQTIRINSSCSSIPLQSSVWTEAITKNVFECLYSQALNKEIASDVLENKSFTAITKLLNDSFRSEAGRAKLVLLLKKAHDAFPIFQKIIAKESAQSVLQLPGIDKNISWLALNIELLAPEFGGRPNRAIQEALDIFSLFPNGDSQLVALRPLLDLLQQSHDKYDNPTRFLLNARHIMATISESSDVGIVLDKLSRNHICKNTSNIVTESPLSTSIDFFKNDRLHPLKFLEASEQGYAFWHKVCQSPTANSPEELAEILNWIFENWNLLQDTIALSDQMPDQTPNKKLNWLDDSIKLIQLSNSSHPKLLHNLFNTNIAKTAIKRISMDKSLRTEWILGLKNWMAFLESGDRGSIEFLQHSLQEMSQHPQEIGDLISISTQLTPKAIGEIFQTFYAVSSDSWPGFKDSVTSGKLLSMLDFFQWILQRRNQPIVSTETPTYSNWEWKSEENLVSIVPNPEAEIAKEFVNQCHPRNSTLNETHSCLQQKGLIFSPTWISPLWSLSADSELLLRAHPKNIEYVSSPELARPFWKKIFRWFSLFKISPDEALGSIKPLNRIIQKHDDFNWNSFLSSQFFKFRSEATRPRNLRERALMGYRLERSSDVSLSPIEDAATRDFLSKPQFLRMLVQDFLTKKEWTASKIALQKLTSKNFSMEFWISDGVKRRVDFNALLALDALSWELQIPVISSNSSIASTLNSWIEVRNPEEAKNWFDSKYFQLGLAEKLFSISNSSGHGVRRRIENAIFIVDALRKRPDNEIQNFIVASKLLVFFHDERSRQTISNTSASALMMLHQMGWVHALNEVFLPSNSWAKKIVRPLENNFGSTQLLKTISEEMKRFIDELPPRSIQQFGQIQAQSDFWFLRSLSTGAVSVLFDAPEFIKIVGQEETLSSDALRKFSQVLRKFVLENPTQLWQATFQLREILKSYPAESPDVNLLSLIEAVVQEPKMKILWSTIYGLNENAIEDLIVWLETGTPQRLMKWNRLMKPSDLINSSHLEN